MTTLSASGFLLLAKGNLLKAKETLQAGEQSITVYMAGEAIVQAEASVRHALEMLKEEETCKP